MRYRVEHEKIKFISTSGHVIFCNLERSECEKCVNHKILSHGMQASVTCKIKVRFADVITTVCLMGSKLLSHGSKDVFADVVEASFEDFQGAYVFGLMFGVKRTITSYCFTLLSKMQMTPLLLVLLFSYAL